MFSPGSKMARDKGCKCDPLQNCYGLGFIIPTTRERLHVKHEDCPFHGVEAEMFKGKEVPKYASI